MKSANSKALIVLLFVSVALLSRYLPHPPNMTAVGALALFTGSLWGQRLLAPLIPLAVLFISDLFLGFHSTMVWVYAGFILVALMGSVLQPQKSWGRTFSAAGLTSLIFFTVSNFGVWATGGLYPLTAQGLAQCYLMALPFLESQVLGDLVFVTAFAVVVRWAEARQASHQKREPVPFAR